MSDSLPLVKNMPYVDPASLFASLAHRPYALFLDSTRMMGDFSRYSFIAVDPFDTIVCHDNGMDAFQELKAKWNAFKATPVPELPPFQGGVAGFLSYDLARQIETLPKPESMTFPVMMLGLYDVVVSFDHQTKTAYILSQGFPETCFKQRLLRAKARIQQVQKLLQNSVIHTKPQPSVALVPQISKAAYCAQIQKARAFIQNGEIFEVNLSQGFQATLPDTFDCYALYLKLRQKNPAPFSAYFHAEDITIASSSPERFLKCTQGCVEAKPIKGTAPRGATVEEDAAFAKQLLASEKDRAENIMIVDLLRNDLSRVCRYETVHVPALCVLESYETVHHLVSTITAELRSECDLIDLLKATFPGGSITGAPKVRAMEIITELETHARGPYCGSVGYLGFDGQMDLSIAIRTFTIKGNQLSLRAGGAVLYDSNPEAEYAETLVKIKSMTEALSA